MLNATVEREKASFDACESDDYKPKGDCHAKTLPSCGLYACAMSRHQKKSAGNDKHKDKKFDAAISEENGHAYHGTGIL